MKAGKDAYCEKPLTLTIDEGKKVGQVARSTGRVVQVGTQQRSDHNRVFLLAVALVRSGRIGKVKKVTAAIGGGPSGGPFKKEKPPEGLNWDMWLGQAPKVDYIKERCHYEFRWWYEYSGGKLTDWGAHHVDVAMWGLGMDNSGPSTIEVTKGVLPVPYKDGWPAADDRYNTPTSFLVKAQVPRTMASKLQIRDDTEKRREVRGDSAARSSSRARPDRPGGRAGRGRLWKNPVPESAAWSSWATGSGSTATWRTSSKVLPRPRHPSRRTSGPTTGP